MFNGDIICRSIYGKGSNFIFIVELCDENHPDGASMLLLNRIMNPVQREYDRLNFENLIKKHSTKDLDLNEKIRII